MKNPFRTHFVPTQTRIAKTAVYDEIENESDAFTLL
jgi:hypothetical protein